MRDEGQGSDGERATDSALSATTLSGSLDLVSAIDSPAGVTTLTILDSHDQRIHSGSSARPGYPLPIPQNLYSTRTLGDLLWVRKLPEGRKAIGSRIVFREKKDAFGKTTKYKARIVAQGFSQVPGRDYNPLLTSSTVFRTTTLRALLAIVAREDWELHQIDVVGAYLQGDLDEEIYMRPPEGVQEPGKEGWFWRLLKSIYGLKQAGIQWKKKLESVLIGILGFKKGKSDDCLYILFDSKSGEIIMIVIVYVDDMAAAAKRLSHTSHT
ncbi:hypothetical protein ONZ51_g12299 [Trametes cubensis]|uniref:Reverse transcriptase Ty1/copia-type domain-containing protein n=1 Tax=Trametes cubensis TaxID=1111947 RepID=A0AAD7X3M3_9APHY|nr:hypothetical protein ONZ51_g12299 [Trametes cubensis]